MSDLYKADINTIQIVLPKLQLGDKVILSGKASRIYERIH